MAFDWQAFAAGFLNEITEGIEEREEAAEDYKEKQEAAAARNAALINERKMRASEAAQYGKKAMALGASPSQVKTAISSGMTGVKDLADKLQAVANQKGMKKLGVDDIEAIVNMPNIPSVNEDLVDMSFDELQKFAQQTYGALPRDKTAQQQQEAGVLKQLFGFAEKDRVKKELSETDYMGGMSIADINEMAQQVEYKSLMPDATMTFLDIEQYRPKEVMEFNEALTEVMNDAVDTEEAKATIKAARLAPGLSIEESAAAESQAIKEIQSNAAKLLIETYAQRYHLGGFFTNELTLKQIEDVAGASYLVDLMTAYGYDEDDDDVEEDPVEVSPPKDVRIEGTKREEGEKFSTEDVETTGGQGKKGTKPTPLRTKEFRKVYYLDDDGNVVNRIPPRPDLELSNVFGGRGLSGEDIENILKGEMPVPKYLRPKQWDEIFGDAYNPDGTIKR